MNNKILKPNYRDMKGFTLVEVIVAVALLVSIGVAILAALGGSSRVLLKADIRESARDLAQAQMEYVQDLEYKTNNPAGVPVFYDKVPNLAADYPGFDAEIHASRIDKGSGVNEDTGIQEITVAVKQGTATIFTLMGMKVNREMP